MDIFIKVAEKYDIYYSWLSKIRFGGMRKHFFTIGYEGRTIEELVRELRANNIECVLDVRQIAFSRKPGFSKSRLAQRLLDASIEYIHMRELGSPKRLREQLKATGDYTRFFREVEDYISGQRDAIEAAYAYVQNKICCLMCFERLAAGCHRKVVAREIKERDRNGLEIRNI